MTRCDTMLLCATRRQKAGSVNLPLHFVAINDTDLHLEKNVD